MEKIKIVHEAKNNLKKKGRSRINGYSKLQMRDEKVGGHW